MLPKHWVVVVSLHSLWVACAKRVSHCCDVKCLHSLFYEKQKTHSLKSKVGNVTDFLKRVNLYAQAEGKKKRRGGDVSQFTLFLGTGCGNK